MRIQTTTLPARSHEPLASGAQKACDAGSPEPTVGGDQRIVIDEASLELWAAFDRDRGERSQPHLGFNALTKELEIVTLGPRHEELKKLVGDMIRLFAGHHRIRLYGHGSTTLESAMGDKAEPDEAWSTHAPPGSGPPEIALEVDVTTRSKKKFAKYQRLGVRELWLVSPTPRGVELAVWDTTSGTQLDRSAVLSPLDLDQLQRVLNIVDQVDALFAWSDWLQASASDEATRL